MMVNRVMKLLAHYLGPGPFQLGNWQDSQSLVKSLDENFYVMEEVKASLLSLLTFEVLVESGLYADRRLNWFAAYMALLMDGLRERNQAVHYRASLIQCNYFLQNGGLAYNMNDRNLIMNVSVFRKNLDDFVGLVVGGYSAPVNLISTYGQIKPELTQLYDKMEEIPRRIIYRWAGDWNKIEEIE